MSDKPCVLQEKGKRKDGFAWTYENGVQEMAHRRAYRLAHPDEDITSREVKHTCAARNCIEPEHLYLAPLGNPKRSDGSQDLLGALDALKWSK
jgi:hypothetical protein